MRSARSFVLLITVTTTTTAQERADFNFDVKPLLSDRCFVCHGPDENNREAELRLDTKAGLFAEAQSGERSHIVSAGRIDQSELIRRITSNDPDVRMPPPGSNLALSEEEVRTLTRWVRQGAPWQGHWAFQPLPKTVPVPTTSKQEWSGQPIDHFVLKRLEDLGMTPASQAGRERLIRRVTFDLTGLPPTPAEIDTFLADGEPGAYDRVVDRLLKSTAYGERMTSEWLDVARYSDSYGYQVDRDRYVWPWRDWVIRAFNNNMPYDQFMTRQLAGDLMPNADQDQILATTFNRLHPQKVEGGSVPEEFRVEYVADRTQTFATAFLGLTLECARCHDHKYDPITQAEYYQFFAFFNNIDEAGLYSYFTPAVPTPTLLLRKGDMSRKLKDLRAKVASAEHELSERTPEQRGRFDQWLAGNPRVEPKGQIAFLDCDKSVGRNQAVPGRVGNALRLTGDDAVGTKVGNFRRFDPFSVSLWLRTPDHKKRAVVFHRSRAWTDAGSRGYQLLIEDGHLSASLIHFWPGNAIRVRAVAPLEIGRWTHVAMTWDGSGRAAGLRLFVNGELAATNIVRDNLYKHITGGGGDTLRIGERFRDNGFKNGLVDEFWVFSRSLTGVEVKQIASGESVDPETVRRDALFEYFLSAIDAPTIDQRNQLRELRQQLCATLDGITEIMVMQERKQQRPTHRLNRGAYDAPAERVEADTPRALPPFPEHAPRNRLGLARWLTSRDHPLTARVVVNRYWQMLFGYGLVRTPEDFGSQGLLPTHPRLLDWLSRDFVDHGWNVKRLLKQIVTSNTYKQRSAVTRHVLETDPENKFLARAPSYRLSAEMLRDQVLAVSGLLVNKIGGPGRRPYDLEQSFKPLARDKGEGLYRRSVYTYWKRTGPAPVMMALDASKKEVCRVRRERTDSPLQAFVLLNGPQFVEAARGLSESVLGQHPRDAPAAIGAMFRRLTGRSANARETRVLLELYQRQIETFRSDQKSARAYLSVGEKPFDSKLDEVELAAFTVVANALLGFDEVVMKR